MNIFDQNYVRRMREWIESPDRNKLAIAKMKESMKGLELKMFSDSLDEMPSTIINTQIGELKSTVTRLNNLAKDINRILNALVELVDNGA